MRGKPGEIKTRPLTPPELRELYRLLSQWYDNHREMEMFERKSMGTYKAALNMIQREVLDGILGEWGTP